MGIVFAKMIGYGGKEGSVFDTSTRELDVKCAVSSYQNLIDFCFCRHTTARWLMVYVLSMIHHFPMDEGTDPTEAAALLKNNQLDWRLAECHPRSIYFHLTGQSDLVLKETSFRTEILRFQGFFKQFGSTTTVEG